MSSSSQDLRTVGAAGRSYVGSGVLVLLLYLLFWLPGFIVNWIYLSAAKRDAAVLGYNPPGRTLLRVEMFLFTLLPLIGGLLLVLAFVMSHQ